ncbi:RagB/SusD family nutrient uptake outer membrane protein [Arachidicoccus sp.]|uniref:RagB/SusD family nutrient uptake outer membrane protein n=1 Tax=Arachidicoccus sp. TaxID=1872624 RepID=UPI003D20891F
MKYNIDKYSLYKRCRPFCKTFLLLAMGTVFFLTSCKKQLDISPKGVVSQEQVNTPEGAEKLVIAAYAQLGNDHYDQAFSLWEYGDVRADDAYKGGRDASDIQDFHFIETWSNTLVNFGEVDALWYNLYIGISRVNAALNAIESLDKSVYPLKNQRMAEMRFLRAHWYFQLKILFKYVPYIDENVPRDLYDTVGNRTYSNDELWQKIADDFQYAAENLPETKTDIGRPDKAAAYAYLAKTKLYQAYMQDEKNNVVEINKDDLQAVVDATSKVMSYSQYGLDNDFGDNFLQGVSDKESIWAVQFSVDDGTMFGRLNFGDVLSTPQGIGCCDFKKPSQNLVNAFKTDANGLPLFDTYNNSDVNPSTDNIDPRLDHTVAIPGRTWKYDPLVIYEDSWNRSPDIYGHYASLKENVKKDDYIQVGPFYANTKHRVILRYADVLLFRAEALIELGRQNEALPLINELRTRAAASNSLLVDAADNPEGHYLVKPYVNGVNINWTQDNARIAFRFERRLEMAEEGSRFFDLVRWGVADQVLNAFVGVEKTKWPFLNDAHFTKNKNEYLPIPLNQIQFSKNLYKQNYGY